MPSVNIAGIRKDYSQKVLSETSINSNPFKQFELWWEEAMSAQIDELNAMTLATASADGVPSARTVLLKDFSDEGFVFFTNYESYKGRQLAENPRASLLFFWKELERQVRIVGVVQKVSEEESDNYFRSRPVLSQIGAIVSPQSTVIESRDWLEERYNQLQQQLAPDAIQRPAHWGGYIVKPVRIEFWQGRPSRLHDRIEYSLQEDGTWKIERLAP
jgi:pyridoxamine 5'-phosphate oxidase